MRLIIFLFILNCFIGCGDQYNLLRPISYAGFNKYCIDDYEFYFNAVDTIKIEVYTTTWRSEIAKNNHLHDFLVELKFEKANDRWENNSLYFLVDADSAIFTPSSIGTYEYPKDEGPYAYEYTVWFRQYKGNYIKFPVTFNFIDTFNNINKIIYTFDEEEPEGY